jgi:hypothetical protein
MQKVILDTNVVVSALIQKSFPYLILSELYLESKIELCISEDLLSEYYEVLSRDKFARFADFKANADAILVNIRKQSSFFHPRHKVKKIKDEDDNMLLELAQECKADFLVTGNTNDFVIKAHKKTRIVTPREYWENYKPE